MLEVVRLLLAALLAVAGVAKLADPAGSRRAVRDSGVPKRLAPALAILLPVTELAIAAALVPSTTARYAAVGAAALLALFAVVIGTALTRGRKPDCHCFGRLYSAPAGWGTLARNAGLALAAVALATQPSSAPSGLELAAAAAIVLVTVQALLSFVLLRRYGKALRRIEELETRPVVPPLAVGVQAPRFDGLEGLLAPRRPVLLVFSEPDCPACGLLEPQLDAWKREHADRLTISVVNGEVLALYGVEVTPSAVLVGADGRISHTLVEGASAIEELVGRAAPLIEPAANSRPRISAAAALAGGLAVTTAAHAGRSSHEALDPELQAIQDALRAGGQRILAAGERSRKAIRAQATLLTGKKAREKRKAARQAIAAERRVVLALRTTIDRLAESSTGAHNVKVIVHNGLTQHALSLQRQERAIGAEPKVARKLVKEAQQLFLKSLGSLAAAGALLKDGK